MKRSGGRDPSLPEEEARGLVCGSSSSSSLSLESGVSEGLEDSSELRTSRMVLTFLSRLSWIIVRQAARSALHACFA